MARTRVAIAMPLESVYHLAMLFRNKTPFRSQVVHHLYVDFQNNTIHSIDNLIDYNYFFKPIIGMCFGHSMHTVDHGIDVDKSVASVRSW